MEKNLRLLIEGVDELAQDTNNFFTYQRTLAKQKQQLVLKKVFFFFSNRYSLST